MWTRAIAISIPFLLAGAALAQTRVPFGHTRSAQPTRDENSGAFVQPFAPTTGGVRSAPPPRMQLGGVRSAAPRPQQGLGGARMGLPFTRMGPTARTIGQAQQEAQQQPTQQQQFAPLHHQPTQFQPLQHGPLTHQPLRLSGQVGLPGAPAFTHDLRAPLHAGVIVTPTHPEQAPPGWIRTHWPDGRPIFIPGAPTFGVTRFGGGYLFSGGYTDNRWRLRLRSGSPFAIKSPCRGGACSGGVCYGGICSPTLIHGSYLAVGPDPALESGPALIAASVDPQLLTPEPQPLAQVPVAFETERDRGDALLYAGQVRPAIAAYRSHLSENPHDAHGMRSIGLAMLAANQLEDGVAMVSLAYKTDPALAGDPIPPHAFGTSAELRRVLERVSVHANRVNMPSAWLTLATLMQAENRYPLASRMVDRAINAGLEPEIAAQMFAALRY